MKAKIRDPKQKRAIEKKERIIQRGFSLICEKGYHNVNTDDIAAYAEVSTGTVYNYFLDKRDIFMQGVSFYAGTVLFPLENQLHMFSFSKDEMPKAITDIVNHCVLVHENSKAIHEEILSMSHIDEELATWIEERELLLATNIITAMHEHYRDTNNIQEKIHIIIGLIENVCHEIVYHKHATLDLDKMKEETIRTIISILK